MKVTARWEKVRDRYKNPLKEKKRKTMWLLSEKILFNT